MLMQAPEGSPMILRVTDAKGNELVRLDAESIAATMLFAPQALPCEIPPGEGMLHVLAVRAAPGPIDQDSLEADEYARAVVKLAGYFETLHPDMQRLYDRALERLRGPRA